jgi:hypothetical protein
MNVGMEVVYGNQEGVSRRHKKHGIRIFCVFRAARGLYVISQNSYEWLI